MKDLSIVILNYNTKELTLKCIETVLDSNCQLNFDVWVVDNCSTDGSQQAIKKRYPDINIIESSKNLGFAGGNNLALRRISSRYALLLNSDTEVIPKAFDILHKFASENNYDIASCMLLNKDNSFQPNAGELPNFWFMIAWLSGLDDLLGKIGYNKSFHATELKYYTQSRVVGWVQGAAMLISDRTFKSIGYLDENIFMYGEDVEYCWRAKNKGFKIGWTKDAKIIHLGGGSLVTPRYSQWLGEFRGIQYLYRKYYGVVPSLMIKIIIFFFIWIRVVAFALIGKFGYSKTYAKVSFNI